MKRIDFKGSATDPAPSNPFTDPAAHQILKLEELRVRTSCIDTGGGNAPIIVAFGSPAKANIDWGYITFNNPGTSTETTGSGVNDTWYPVIDLQGELRSADGQVIFSNKKRTITVACMRT